MRGYKDNNELFMFPPSGGSPSVYGTLNLKLPKPWKVKGVWHPAYTHDIDRKICNYQDLVDYYVREYGSEIASKGARAALGGWSFGGNVAQSVLAEVEKIYSIRVRALILIDPKPALGNKRVSEQEIKNKCCRELLIDSGVPDAENIEIRSREHALRICESNGIGPLSYLGREIQVNYMNAVESYVRCSFDGMTKGISESPSLLLQSCSRRSNEELSEQYEGWRSLLCGKYSSRKVDIPHHKLLRFSESWIKELSDALAE